MCHAPQTLAHAVRIWASGPIVNKSERFDRMIRCANAGRTEPISVYALVKPMELLGQTVTPDGTDMKLTRRTNQYIILANGKSLMSSRMHGSEEALATLACRRVRTMEQPCGLVRGLGMGFTVRGTLDLLPPDAVGMGAELGSDW